MSMIEAFIGNLDKAGMALLDYMESNWFCTDHPQRNQVLVAIIGEKLRRYEEEY